MPAAKTKAQKPVTKKVILHSEVRFVTTDKRESIWALDSDSGEHFKATKAGDDLVVIAPCGEEYKFNISDIQEVLKLV